MSKRRRTGRKNYQQPPTPTWHPEGCTWGGFSHGYWLVAENCKREHPNPEQNPGSSASSER